MMHHYSLTRGEKQKGKRQNDNQEKEGTVKSLVAKPWLKVEQARPLVSSVGIRGISAGQGASCGFGMRGQKSRSGPAVTIGFEGGQMPLYRRIPKLRGIAGETEDAKFKEGEEVSLEFLKAKGVINTSGRERRLPLKILGEGELSKKLTLKARAFSTSAKEKLENVGCSLTVLSGRKKWVKSSDNC
ncbi:50S ribosomal protein L15, chloroplastic [Glycine soja]|uniref:50S ribosomal protein L15, chloroplastic n=1 Tax=Glycine soja TaxID=3848 RepID=A0A445ITN5_GLYSO|nr:50S ribosomal protein L15, chloroplastic [Glycine soja]